MPDLSPSLWTQIATAYEEIRRPAGKDTWHPAVRDRYELLAKEAILDVLVENGFSGEKLEELCRFIAYLMVEKQRSEDTNRFGPLDG